MPSKDDLAALRLKLQRQRREIDDRLKALELVETMLAGSERAVAPRQPELIVSATFQDLNTTYKAVSLREACKDVLATQGDWSSTNEITDAIKAGGFPFASGTPRGSISTTLSRMQERNEVDRKKVAKENLWRLKGS
jgi:hypothetical protein